MADYKGIKGFKVQSLASDPSNTLAGEVWYNTTSAALKLFVQPAAGWSSGGNLNTARTTPGGAGSQTAALAIGGMHPPGTPLTAVEQYDGSAWTELSANLNTGKREAGSTGTTTSALSFGGNNPPPGATETESYNGTAWTEVADLNTGRWAGASLGADNTAAVYAGGQNAPDPTQNTSETWNGTAWTEGNNLNTGRFQMSGTGPTTAGLIAGGNVNPPTDYVAWVETYNGTSWTETTDIPAGDAGMGSASQGTTTAAFYFGGTLPGPGTGGLFWNGSAWTTSPAMATARTNNLQQCGTQTSALAFGADPSSATTEEYSDPAPIVTKTVTIS
jgi:hypothetical protein